MNPLTDVRILRVYLGESAEYGGKPLYEEIVIRARQRGMAGATVVRGFMGFGANSLLHTAKILRLSEDLPVIVEIVDTAERIDDFLPIVDAMVEEGAVVVEQAQAVFHLPMRVRDVMSADVATVDAHAPLSSVVELLLKRNVKALPVLEDGKLKGMITGGDLLKRAGMPLRLDVQCQLPPQLREEHIRCADFEGVTAKDVMSSPVTAINIKKRVPEVLELMAGRKLKRLPVVDDSGKLMGIVSRVDVLQAIAKAAWVSDQLPELPSGIHGTARDVMFENVPTANIDTPLEAVLDRLLTTPLRRVVVTDAHRKVLGIVLDRDLVELYAKRSKPGILRSLVAALSGKQAPLEAMDETAGQVMKTDVFTLRPETPLAEVVRLLVERGAKRMVVTDEQGRLLGMVDREAVLRGLAGY